MTEGVNWSAIRTEYESGSSLRTLAAKHGVSKSAIAKRKYKEQWTEKAKSSGQVDNSHNTGAKTRDLNMATRVHLAIKIYLEEHVTWKEIADRVGYASAGACHHAVMKVMNEILTHDVQELRTFELYRLEQVQARCYKAATDPENETGWTWATDRFLATSKRKSELMNLDIKPDDVKANIVVIREVPHGLLPVKAIQVTGQPS